MNPELFVNNWLESWNSHNIEKILSHYTEDFSITSPLIKNILGSGDTIVGKDKISNYWQTALKMYPDLKFELIDYTLGVSTIAIYYKSISNRKCIEFMVLDDNWKVKSVFANYK